MTFTPKDAAATLLTALAALAFVATHEGWNVALIGHNHRWAAAAILLLGVFTCGLGSPGKDAASKVLATLGVLALVFGALALATGSLTPLSFLTVDVVVLWAVSTWRHVHTPHRAVPA